MLVLFSVLCALFLSEDITYFFFTSLLVPIIFSLFFFLQVVGGYYMVINVFFPSGIAFSAFWLKL